MNEIMNQYKNSAHKYTFTVGKIVYMMLKLKTRKHMTLIVVAMRNFQNWVQRDSY